MELAKSIQDTIHRSDVNKVMEDDKGPDVFNDKHRRAVLLTMIAKKVHDLVDHDVDVDAEYVIFMIETVRNEIAERFETWKRKAMQGMIWYFMHTMVNGHDDKGGSGSGSGDGSGSGGSGSGSGGSGSGSGDGSGGSGSGSGDGTGSGDEGSGGSGSGSGGSGSGSG